MKRFCENVEWGVHIAREVWHTGGTSPNSLRHCVRVFTFKFGVHATGHSNVVTRLRVYGL